MVRKCKAEFGGNFFADLEGVGADAWADGGVKSEVVR